MLLSRQHAGDSISLLLTCASVIPWGLSLFVVVRHLLSGPYLEFTYVFWRRLKDAAEHTHEIPYGENIIEDSASFPDSVLFVPVYSVSLLTLFMVADINLNLSRPVVFMGIISIFLFAILTLFVAGILRHPGFKEKLSFALLGITFNIPLVLYANIPNIAASDYYNPLISETSIAEFRELIDLANAETSDKKKDAYLISAYRMAAANHLAACVSVFVVSFLLVVLFLRLPPLIAKPRDRLFRGSSEESRLHIALSGGSFPELFSFSILLFWLFTNVSILVGFYTSFTFFEASLSERSSILNSIDGIIFYEHLRAHMFYLLYPTLSLEGVAIFLKVLAVIHILPLILILFGLVRHRVISYRNKINEFSSFNGGEECAPEIVDVVEKISSQLQMPVPRVVLKGSDSIQAKVDYIGRYE